MVRPEDRNIVIAVATQMWCARIQAQEAKLPNGQQKYGYTPDVDLIVGEAAAIVEHASKLVEQVDAHIPPRERRQAQRERASRGAIELQWNVASVER